MTRSVFSVVMPTHNSERFVGEAITSVLQQTFESWELICVDDASDDGTRDVLNDFKKLDDRIKVLYRERNGGPAKARNEAISHSKGRYIAFLDSDDLWHKDKLQRQHGLFVETGASLVFTGYEKIDESGTIVGRIVGVPESITYQGLLKNTVIATCTAAYDSERVGKVFMPDIRKRQDFALWLKLLRAGGEARGINEALAYLRKRPNSLSSNKFAAALYVWRVYRDLEAISWPRAAVYFAQYAYHASVKARI